MNTVLLIGRITHDVEVKQVGEGYNVCSITLAVRREFKNQDGEYDVDFIPVSLWEGAAYTCQEICRKGSLISLKARIQISKRETADKKVFNQVDIIGEKLTLLSNPKIHEQEQ